MRFKPALFSPDLHLYKHTERVGWGRELKDGAWRLINEGASVHMGRERTGLVLCGKIAFGRLRVCVPNDTPKTESEILLAAYDKHKKA